MRKLLVLALGIFLIAGCTSFVKASVDTLAGAGAFITNEQNQNLAACTANPKLQICLDLNTAVAAQNSGISALEAYCQLPVAPDAATLATVGKQTCNESPTAKSALISALSNITTIIVNFKKQYPK